jgi:hypothetical protein
MTVMGSQGDEAPDHFAQSRVLTRGEGDSTAVNAAATPR